MKKIKWKTLGEIIEYEQPTKYIVDSKKYNDNFSTPVLTAGQSFILGYTNETEGIYNASVKNPVIIFDDFTTSIQWIDFDFKVKSAAIKILKNKDSKINLRYCYHCMKIINFDASEHRRKWISQYSKIKIPIPPLKKQAEIAAVLDKFTELTEELTARETQYDYYRNMLLIDQWNDKNIKFENAEIIRTTVGDIIERCSEKAKNDKNVATVYTVSSEFGLIPSIDYWKRKGSKNKKSYKMFSDDTSNYNIVRKNMFAYNPARLNIGSISCLLNEKTGLLSPMYNVFKIKENIILPKYLLYFLKTPTVINKIDLMKESGARNRFDFEKWKKIEISIPAIGVQQKILNILDSFETLVNDIRQGLPKEIELRQKQYEYYREKLLTFEEE